MAAVGGLRELLLRRESRVEREREFFSSFFRFFRRGPPTFFSKKKQITKKHPLLFFVRIRCIASKQRVREKKEREREREREREFSVTSGTSKRNKTRVFTKKENQRGLKETLPLSSSRR